MSAEKNRCGVDTSKCIDWTTTRRAGYKAEPDEPQYSATRGFNSTGKSSKKSENSNKSESKKRSTVKTNKLNASSKRSNTANQSKS